MTHLSRRAIVVAGLGLGVAAAGGCSVVPRPTVPPAGPGTPVPMPSPLAPAPGQRVVDRTLTARPAMLDLGGPTVATWTYGSAVPGPLIRATAGDFVRVTLRNELPADTTVHWHGIRLHNAADGVPGMTQQPVAPGGTFVYGFTAPDPGTYFCHPHVGVQLDRGLYAPVVIDDPREPGAYDAEWVVVLDDWVDGTGRTPDDVLARLIADGGAAGQGGGMGGMGGMGGGGHGGGGAPWGDAGEVTYPYYLVNGRVPSSPEAFTARPGHRIRLRIINAAADTVFAVALGGHRLTLTHTDGYAVVPQEVGAVYLGMGERHDATVTLGDGVFPLVARPFGKDGRAMALVRTGSGAAPGPDVEPAELGGRVALGSELLPAPSSLLPARPPDATAALTLEGSMTPYRWGINGAPYGSNVALTVKRGQRLRLNVRNLTMMTHPLHLHGHTFALRSGLRKDTVLLAPMQAMPIELDADNAGDWMVHCHNVYHAEAGMMIGLRYVA